MTLVALTKLLRAMDVVRNEAPNMPSQQLHLLLAVAANEGSSMIRVQQICGMSDASGSRSMRAMYHNAGEGKIGLGFVRTEQNPRNLRERLVYLTDEGRSFVQRFISPIEDTHNAKQTDLSLFN